MARLMLPGAHVEREISTADVRKCSSQQSRSALGWLAYAPPRKRWRGSDSGLTGNTPTSHHPSGQQHPARRAWVPAPLCCCSVLCEELMQHCSPYSVLQCSALPTPRCVALRHLPLPVPFPRISPASHHTTLLLRFMPTDPARSILPPASLCLHQHPPNPRTTPPSAAASYPFTSPSGLRL